MLNLSDDALPGQAGYGRRLPVLLRRWWFIAGSRPEPQVRHVSPHAPTCGV